MSQAYICPIRQKLLLAQLGASFKIHGIGAAERKVTGSILVNARVVEDSSHSRDGRILRNQGHFTQIRCPFIGLQQGSQILPSRIGIEFHHFPVLEG
ncbi:hypothetical protein D3C85_1595540 [compost metagenome]